MAVAVLLKSLLALAPAVSLDGSSLRFLALNVRNGHEQYSVHVQRSDAWEPAALEHASGDEWRLSIGDDTQILHAGAPDIVFAAAMGVSTTPSLRAAAPHWPPSLLQSLETRRLSHGTIAFDAATFLELLATTPVDAPLLLPDAASRLGLDGLARARDIVATVHHSDFAETMLARANEWERRVARARRRGSATTTGGRLIGHYPDGELIQMGSALADGLRVAVGHGTLRATFPPDAPMGIGFGPLSLVEGRGAEVGEVDAGSVAAHQGVGPSMVLVGLECDGEVVMHHDLREMAFDDVLAAVDDVRDAGRPLTLVLDTAAPAERLYCVEMPADGVFGALAAADDAWRAADVDASGAIAALLEDAGTPPPLWAEVATKAFVGDAGSLTCAHSDIAPDLELCHGLAGAKLIGVASHDATPRLAAEHVARDDDDDDERVSTAVPTHRPLRPHESALLSDGDVSVACVLPGDLCVFSSAALHFASNGADGVSAALFHGIVTDASLPRLVEAARRGSGGADDQMSAADVLRQIAQRK